MISILSEMTKEVIHWLPNSAIFTRIKSIIEENLFPNLELWDYMNM